MSQEKVNYISSTHCSPWKQTKLLHTTYTKTVFLDRKTLIFIPGYHASGWATSFTSEQNTIKKNILLIFSAETIGIIPCWGCIWFPLSFLLRTWMNPMKTTQYRVRRIDDHVPQWKTGDLYRACWSREASGIRKGQTSDEKRSSPCLGRTLLGRGSPRALTCKFPFLWLAISFSESKEVKLIDIRDNKQLTGMVVPVVLQAAESS